MGKIDTSFKALGERSPSTMIRLFGHTPDDPPTVVRRVERELSLPPMSVDEAYLVERGGEQWVEHFESEMVISRDDMKRIAGRATLLSYKENAPVWTTVILMSEQHAPAREVPELIEEKRGGLTVTVKVNVLKLWQQPARALLESGVVDVLPMIGAMKVTPEELEIAARRMEAVADRGLRSQLGAEFTAWAGLNYNKIDLDEIRSRFRMVTAIDLWRASPVGLEAIEAGKEYLLEQARVQGLEQGLEQGLQKAIETAREQLELVAESRFPGILTADRIAALDDLEAIRRIFRVVVAAKDAGDVQAAIGG